MANGKAAIRNSVLLRYDERMKLQRIGHNPLLIAQKHHVQRVDDTDSPPNYGRQSKLQVICGYWIDLSWPMDLVQSLR